MKTRWESCVFIVLMLLPGAWLLNTSLRPGESPTLAQNQSGSGTGEPTKVKRTTLPGATPDAQKTAADWRLDMYCLDTVNVPPFRVQPNVDKLRQKAVAQEQMSTKER